MTEAPQWFRDADALAETIIREIGNNVVLALPLGLGKANHVANALYARAAADRTVRLTIFTALTLEKPRPGSEIERRFLEPIVERLFGGYPELAYAEALRHGALPPNIEVNEFFFLAGQWLHVPAAQQNYVSANYTQAGRYVLQRGVNVIAQLVAKRIVNGATRFSLSCNTDITLDFLQARAEGKGHFILVGQVNPNLPFMPGAGDLPAETLSHVLDAQQYDFPLFASLNETVDLAEYAKSFHVASLIPDGGTLQIGIGKGGDALAQCLILRHRETAAYRDALLRLSTDGKRHSYHDGPFDTGLYGMSEMFFDALLALVKAGVLKREVDGAVLHGAFFLGSTSFYCALREMSETDLLRLQMTAVSFTNQLYGDEEKKRRARTKACFVNYAMMATLLGAVISDGLEDGRVVSGVGGQHDFVSQAFALEGARSIITLNATRQTQGKISSNIRWCYGRETIPCHLRDIAVSEYGVADLRGKSDRDVIAAMLSIADSRAQPELLRRAQDAGKIPKTFEIPSLYRENIPERIERALAPLKEDGFLPAFPFGTEFSDIEQSLLPALRLLKDSSGSLRRLLPIWLQGLSGRDRSKLTDAALARLGLAGSKAWRERLSSTLVRGALRQAATAALKDISH